MTASVVYSTLYFLGLDVYKGISFRAYISSQEIDSSYFLFLRFRMNALSGRPFRHIRHAFTTLFELPKVLLFVPHEWALACKEKIHLF